MEGIVFLFQFLFLLAIWVIDFLVNFCNFSCIEIESMLG